jgi:hypothetical protein
MPHLLLAKGDRIDYWIPQHIIQYCYGTHPPANSLFETRMNGTGTTRQFIPQAARLGSRAAFVCAGVQPVVCPWRGRDLQKKDPAGVATRAGSHSNTSQIVPREATGEEPRPCRGAMKDRIESESRLLDPRLTAAKICLQRKTPAEEARLGLAPAGSSSNTSVFPTERRNYAGRCSETSEGHRPAPPSPPMGYRRRG